MNLKNLFVLFFFLIARIVTAQNTPFIWKHTTNSGQSVSITQDANLNTYVVTDQSKVVKIKPNSQATFVNSYLPTGYTFMTLHDIKYINGNIFLGGLVSNASNNEYNKAFLAKIDTMGNIINQMVLDSFEVNLFMGIKSGPPYSFGFYSDNQQNLYVGYNRPVSVNSSQPIYTIRKYNQNLNLLAFYQDTVPFVQSGPYIVSQDANVYHSYSGSVTKVNSNFNGQAWRCTFPDYEYITMMGLDNNNNIYVLTKEYGIFNNYITRVIKIADLGNTYNIIYNQIIDDSEVEFKHLLVDPINNTFYTSGFYYSIPPYQRKIKKHSTTDATLVWSDSAYSVQSASDILLSDQGNLIAVGGGTDYYVWFYNNTGNIESTYIYNGPCGANDGITAAIVEPNNKLVVTGAACENANTVAYATTLKYTIPTIITTDLHETKSDKVFKLSPNPANEIVCLNPSTQVKQASAIDSKGSLVWLPIFNNCVDVSSLNNGIYVLRIQLNDQVINEKLFIAR